MRSLAKGGLAVAASSNGYLDHLILVYATSSYGAFLKDRVYRKKPRSIEELKNAITTAISAINSNLCQTVYRSVTDRLR